ncbi:MAG TPA: Mpo1-like protein [Casimicrobiaceae bacterium]|nr:Mpo1-like protein [Casimicrobiaceae bacterium]
MSRAEALFERYGEYHRNPTNKAIHWACVPLIVWSLLGMLWAASPFAVYAAILLAMAFYVWLPLSIAVGMLLMLVVMAYLLTLLGPQVLVVSVGVFVVAWIGQFIGHAVEGRRPAFFEDIRSLLVGPAWVLAEMYRRLGIAY